MSKDIIQLNEEVVKNELKELVRNSVEETLNELLNKVNIAPQLNTLVAVG